MLVLRLVTVHNFCTIDQLGAQQIINDDGMMTQKLNFFLQSWAGAGEDVNCKGLFQVNKLTKADV